MHKEELKDVVKDLFGDFTESEYLKYFTSRFPRLLVYCYNVVEKEARDLLVEYFHEDALAQAPTAAIGTRAPELYGSKLTINCKDVITFPDTKVKIDFLMITNISHLFIEQNKSFTNFLQSNGSNVTQLEFDKGFLKFNSMNKILQKLPNLKEIKFKSIRYEASKTNQTIQQTTCRSLENLVILSAESSNLLQAFLECQTMKKLTVKDSEVTLDEILQKYASLEELHVEVRDNHPVSHQHETNANMHQLKVLKITLGTKDEKIHQQLFGSILKLKNLQQFEFNSPWQSLCKQLAAHICKLERLSSLLIYDKKLLEEVELFAANNRVENTCLEEFICQLRHFKTFPSLFLGHFTNLWKVDINCDNAEETKVADLISFMDKTQLTSITLRWLPSAYFALFQHLQIQSLEVLVIQINNEPEDEVPPFDVLQEFMPRHPNITQFEIRFWNDYDEPKSLELIPMILTTLTQLERLVVWRCPKITENVIKPIAALKTLKSWKINDHKSETFYLT